MSVKLFLKIAATIVLLAVAGLSLVFGRLTQAEAWQTEENVATPAPTYPLKPEDKKTPPTPFPVVELPPMTPVTFMDDAKPTPPPYTPPPTPGPETSVNVVISELRVPNTEFATKNAEAVVVATVRQILEARWTTATGERPQNPWEPGNRHYIYTPAILQVQQYLKGEDRTSIELLIAIPGGHIGSDSVTYRPDYYELEENAQVIVFLDSPQPTEQTKDLPPWKLSTRYSIVDGRVDEGYPEKLTVEETVAKILLIVDQHRSKEETSSKNFEEIYIPFVSR